MVTATTDPLGMDAWSLFESLLVDGVKALIHDVCFVSVGVAHCLKIRISTLLD